MGHRCIVSADETKTAHIDWARADCEASTERPLLVRHNHFITAIAPLDGGRIVTAALDGEVFVWEGSDRATPTLLPTNELVGIHSNVAVLGDGRLLTSASGQLFVWDSLTEPRPIAANSGFAYEVSALSTLGVAVRNEDGLSVVDVDTGVWSAAVPIGDGYAILGDVGGDLLLGSQSNEVLSIWDVDTKQLTVVLEDHDAVRVEATDDGALLLISDGQIRHFVVGQGISDTGLMAPAESRRFVQINDTTTAAWVTGSRRPVDSELVITSMLGETEWRGSIQEMRHIVDLGDGEIMVVAASSWFIAAFE